MNVLSTRNLSKSFGGLDAVQNVDLSIPQGQVRALIGPNGAGKTTLVDLICGRIEPSQGTVSFLGQDVTRLPVYQRIGLGIGYTFQITSVYSNLNLRENVALAVRWRVRQQGELENEVVAALAQVGLEDRIDQLAGDLSYGHQRLLEIAMGLGQKPKLLILDEPTQGLSEGEI
ncbi:MAG: ATP-binding cassette domain-containing protein, partial [Rhodobacteraceae bacterium]|nr:ATP-binding cassette domain-containing protein [Paracoccaceae bacterium]